MNSMHCTQPMRSSTSNSASHSDWVNRKKAEGVASPITIPSKTGRGSGSCNRERVRIHTTAAPHPAASSPARAALGPASRSMKGNGGYTKPTNSNRPPSRTSNVFSTTCAWWSLNHRLIFARETRAAATRKKTPAAARGRAR